MQKIIKAFETHVIEDQKRLNELVDQIKEINKLVGINGLKEETFDKLYEAQTFLEQSILKNNQYIVNLKQKFMHGEK